MNLGASSTYLSSNGTVRTLHDEPVWSSSMSTLHGDLHASESTNEMDAKFAFQLTTRGNVALVGDPPLTSLGESKEWKFTIPLAWAFDVATRRQNENFWSLKRDIDSPRNGRCEDCYFSRATDMN
ncbi:hypothetical protein K443DRAFT_684868 [Laccaria amethystina LaAM-08-1]|uniref:Unplaced genomic scaffold K443scaffold_337, whole genome shotgun sequence n=1 Tax=Laccaria amethystina LaAM-08-1 TaxID=1095629 RepID=A0A0C9WPR5_9AGAR|nr:hypothetical protein K443DRAFT_684868 [Laccaria amethystina LaAM-08-1]